MAVTLDAATLRDRLKLADDVAGNAEAARLLPLVTEIVTRYARAAPAALANEAAVRTAGYLSSATPDAMAFRKVDVGDDLSIEMKPAGSALRLSGAMSLLSPYRVRRAPVADDD